MPKTKQTNTNTNIIEKLSISKKDRRTNEETSSIGNLNLHIDKKENKKLPKTKRDDTQKNEQKEIDEKKKIADLNRTKTRN